MGVEQDRVVRCPRLGGEVPFSYCAREQGDLPCRMVVRCWGSLIPMEVWLREHLSPEERERFCRELPRDRMATLLDLVDQAKKREGTP